MQTTTSNLTPAGPIPGVGSSGWFDSLRVRLRNLWHWRTAWAYRYLVREMKRDPDYAHTWQCNIACPLMDEGMSHDAANRAADRLMRHLFGVKSNGEHEPRPSNTSKLSP